MSVGSANLSNTAIDSLANYQQQLLESFNQASSGKRITSAAVDPSGLAIYNALLTQAQGYDQGSANVADASNAINVADGSAANTQNDLAQLNNLAIQGSNDFLSASDRQALQAQANQIVQQINSNATDTNFNGTALLNGSFSGTTPATNASASLTQNAQLAGGGTLVATGGAAPSAAPGAQAGTIGVSVVALSSTTTGAQLTFTDSATGQTTNIGSPVAQGSTNTVNGTTFTLGSFGQNDVGTSSTIQVQGAQAGTSGPSLNVQSGPNAGQSVSIALPNTTSAGLTIQNIDLSSSASSTNAQGQISAALSLVGSGRANLGAQADALSTDLQNNQTASLNLTSSASAIGDTNAGSIAIELSSLQTRSEISIATINNANVTYGYLNRFLNVPA